MTKANAFMTFVHKWRRNNAGGRPMSLTEAVNRCGDIWQVMTTEERSPYVEEARIINLQLRGHRNQEKRATETMVREAVEANDVENCDSEHENENENGSSMKVLNDNFMAGFGRGRTRGRLPTLSEVNH